MKKNNTNLLRYPLLSFALLACISLSAQRGDRNGGGSSRGSSSTIQRGSSQPSRSFSRPSTAPARTFTRPNTDRFSNRGSNATPSRQFSPVQRQAPTRNSDANVSRSFNRPDYSRPGAPDQRDRVNSRSYNNNRDVNINRNSNRNVTINSNRRYDYNVNRNRSYAYTNNRRYAAPYRYSYSRPYYGQRYTSLNFNYNVVRYGGIGYCYYGGIFYRPFGSYYQVVAPPIGISINILPFGYTRFYVGGIPYYYYGSTFYRPYDNYYRVVEPPLGAKLPALPSTAKEVFINGQRFFEDNGTYYMEEYNINNQRLYTVVGTNGVLDTEQIDRITNAVPSSMIEDNDDQGVSYSSLPANSTMVNINGEEYYRSPDDVYYQQISDGKQVSYRIVSK